MESNYSAQGTEHFIKLKNSASVFAFGTSQSQGQTSRKQDVRGDALDASHCHPDKKKKLTWYFSFQLSHVAAPHEVLCPSSHGIPVTMTENRGVEEVKRRSGTYSSSRCEAQLQATLILMFHLHGGHSHGPWVPPSHLQAEVVCPLQAPQSHTPVPAEHLNKAASHSATLRNLTHICLAWLKTCLCSPAQLGEQLGWIISHLSAGSPGLALEISIDMWYDFLLLKPFQSSQKAPASPCLVHDSAQKEKLLIFFPFLNQVVLSPVPQNSRDFSPKRNCFLIFIKILKTVVSSRMQRTRREQATFPTCFGRE